jgi:hypothetical protein
VVAAVRDALERGAVEEMADPVREQVRYIREALGDLVVELDVASLPPQLRPNEDLPDSDALRETMPQLVPPLSATIVDDRQDRL